MSTRFNNATFADSRVMPESTDVILRFKKLVGDSLAADKFMSTYVKQVEVNSDSCKIVVGNADFGVMSGRGVNNAFPVGQTPGGYSRTYKPGYFGEELIIAEDEAIRALNSRTDLEFAQSYAELIGDRLLTIQDRAMRLQKKMASDLMFRGAIEVRDKKGVVVYSERDILTATTASSSISSTSSTPIAELLNLKEQYRKLIGRAEFYWGRDSRIACGPDILNKLMMNRNANDLWGYFKEFNQVPGTEAAINAVLSALDLPQLDIIQSGYNDDANSNAVTDYAPADTVAWVGKSPKWGLTTMAMQITTNYQAGGRPAWFAQVIPDPKGLMPPSVVGGWNGGFGIVDPNQIALLRWVF